MHFDVYTYVLLLIINSRTTAGQDKLFTNMNILFCQYLLRTYWVVQYHDSEMSRKKAKGKAGRNREKMQKRKRLGNSFSVPFPSICLTWVSLQGSKAPTSIAVGFIGTNTRHSALITWVCVYCSLVTTSYLSRYNDQIISF